MARKLKRTTVGFGLHAAAVALGLAGLGAMVASGAVSADQALASMGVYAAAVACALGLVGFVLYRGPREEEPDAVAVVATAVAVFLLARVAVALAGDRVLLASGLFTWNAANAAGWTVFQMTVASAVCLVLSAALLAVGAFLGAPALRGRVAAPEGDGHARR